MEKIKNNNTLTSIPNIKEMVIKLSPYDRVCITGKSKLKFYTCVNTPDEITISSNNKLSVIRIVLDDKNSVGYICGDPHSFFEYLTVKENFSMIADFFKLDKNLFEERVECLAEHFNAKKFLNMKINNLNRLERLKCEIIASLITKPSIIFLNEHDKGLCINDKKIINNLILEFADKENVAIITSTNDLNQVKNICNRVILIDGDTLVLDESLDSITKKHLSECFIVITYNNIISYLPLNSLYVQWKKGNNICIKVDLTKTNIEVLKDQLEKIGQIKKVDFEKQSLRALLSQIC